MVSGIFDEVLWLVNIDSEDVYQLSDVAAEMWRGLVTYGRVDATDLNLIVANWQNGMAAATAEAPGGNRRLPRAPLAGQAKANSTSVTDAVLASLDHESLSMSEIDFFSSDTNATTTMRRDITVLPQIDFQTSLAGERNGSPWIDRYETKRLERSGSLGVTDSLQLAVRTLDEVFALSLPGHHT